MKKFKPSEKCLAKIKEIEQDAQKYVDRHNCLPNAVAVTPCGLRYVKEARKAGIIPMVNFKGIEFPVNIRYGGIYYD